MLVFCLNYISVNHLLLCILHLSDELLIVVITPEATLTARNVYRIVECRQPHVAFHHLAHDRGYSCGRFAIHVIALCKLFERSAVSALQILPNHIPYALTLRLALIQILDTGDVCPRVSGNCVFYLSLVTQLIVWYFLLKTYLLVIKRRMKTLLVTSYQCRNGVNVLLVLWLK